MPNTLRPQQIELRLRNVTALFNSLDPSPFQEKDLDVAAEEFIVSWARELPANTPLVLRLHLEEPPATDPVPMVREALRNYFTYRGELLHREFKQLMRLARTSLFIGLTFLAVCMVVSVYLLPQEGNALATFLRESVVIVGWVAMWRPLELYLYEWWPLTRKKRLYDRLARMEVVLA